MLKDAPIGSPIFHIYNVLYLTLFTGLMTFAMLLVYNITYQAPNPLDDVEKMLGDDVSMYTITQKNISKDSLSSLDEGKREELLPYFDKNEMLRFYITDKTTGAPVMTVISVVSGGFGGPVRALVGTDGEKVLNLRVIDVVTETAGLGQRVAEFGFQRQFLNKTLDELPMDRTEWGAKGMDMISGATFSSATIVNNIQKALALYQVGEN